MTNFRSKAITTEGYQYFHSVAMLKEKDHIFSGFGSVLLRCGRWLGGRTTASGTHTLTNQTTSVPSPYPLEEWYQHMLALSQEMDEPPSVNADLSNRQYFERYYAD